MKQQIAEFVSAIREDPVKNGLDSAVKNMKLMDIYTAAKTGRICGC